MTTEAQANELNHVIDESEKWWASVDTDNQDETVFLSRKEAGQWCLLDRISVDQDTSPTIEDFKFSVKELHGGGIYEAVIRTPKGALARRIPFSLAGLPKRQREEQPQQLAPVQPENGLKEVLMMIAESNRQAAERQEKLLLAIMEQNKKPEVDPFVMFERAASVMSKNGATAPAPKTMLEQMLELKQIKDILSEDVVGATGSDGWGAVTAALGPLSEVLKENTINERLKLQIALKQTQNKAPVPPAVPANVPQVVQTIAAPKFAALIAKFKPVLSGLIPYVEQGQPPSMIASALLASVPVDDQAELLEFLSRDDALNDMARLEPKVANHWEWFSELANELIDLIEQAHPDDTGTRTAPTAPTTPEPKAEIIGGSAGDKANVTDHGQVNPPRPRKSRSKGASVTTGETA